MRALSRWPGPRGALAPALLALMAFLACASTPDSGDTPGAPDTGGGTTASTESGSDTPGETPAPDTSDGPGDPSAPETSSDPSGVSPDDAPGPSPPPETPGAAPRPGTSAIPAGDDRVPPATAAERASSDETPATAVTHLARAMTARDLEGIRRALTPKVWQAWFTERAEGDEARFLEMMAAAGARLQQAALGPFRPDPDDPARGAIRIVTGEDRSALEAWVRVRRIQGAWRWDHDE